MNMTLEILFNLIRTLTTEEHVRGPVTLSKSDRARSIAEEDASRSDAKVSRPLLVQTTKSEAKIQNKKKNPLSYLKQK
jgi:hypothetical protein